PIIRSAPARSSRLSRLSVSRKRSWGVLVTACPFCERILLRHYNHLWTEGDEGIVSFEPLDPVTPGHRLVVPVRHTPDAVAAPILAGKVMTVAAYIAPPLNAVNFITSAGLAA